MQKRIRQRYNLLRKEFKADEFILDKASDLLYKEFKDPKDSVITVLSDLKKEKEKIQKQENILYCLKN